MNILDVLKKYTEVADFLADTANKSVLVNLTTCLEQKQFYLPFIGQFSAGKSMLINRLIGKNILPTKSMETTAFLTYISYAETELATLEYVDGSKVSIDVTQIKELDYKHTCNDKAIAALRYEAPIELLKSGLILVDTPGVNTLISEHVKMTEELLQNAQFIVYVSSSSLTETDKHMIKNIDELGIDTIYVRTHIDEIHESEEDVTNTIQKEISIIQSIIERDILYYTLCNDPNSNEFEKWTCQYDNFKEYISLYISSSIEKIYSLCTANRLMIMKNQFEKALNSRLESLQKNSEKSDAEIKEMIAELSKQKHTIQSKLDMQADRINISSNSTISKVEFELQRLQKNLVNEFNENLEDYESSDDLQSTAKDLFDKKLPEAVEKLNEKASSEFNDWKDSILLDIQDHIKKVNIDLQPFGIEFNSDFNDTSITSYEAMIDANIKDISEKYYQLKKLRENNDEELSNNEIERQSIEETLQKYEAIIAQSRQDIQQAVNNYVPQKIQTGGNLGKKLKQIGRIGDIAMLFIPAAGWGKAGTMLAKSAGNLAKHGGMMAKMGSDALNIMSKTANVLKNTDTALDITKMIGYAQKGQNPIQVQMDKKNKTGIFDYLSLSYWFEKVGNAFDPVNYVEDTTHKMEFDRLINQKRANLNLQVQQKVALEKKLRNITEQQQLEKLEKEQRALLEEKMLKELEYEKEKYEQERKNKIKSLIITNAQGQFNEKVTDYTKTLIARTKEELVKASNNISEAMISFVNSQIEDVQTELTELREKRVQAEYNINKDKEDISNQIAKLDFSNE